MSESLKILSEVDRSAQLIFILSILKAEWLIWSLQKLIKVQNVSSVEHTVFEIKDNSIKWYTEVYHKGEKRTSDVFWLRLSMNTTQIFSWGHCRNDAKSKKMPQFCWSKPFHCTGKYVVIPINQTKVLWKCMCESINSNIWEY